MPAMKLSDPLVAPSRGSVRQTYDFAVKKGAQRLSFLLDFLNENRRLSKIDGFDASIIEAQSAHETGNWAGRGFEGNTNWTELGNPGGLAITNSENKSLVYKTGAEAAQAMHVHEWIYRYGALKPTDHLYQYRHLDGHYKEAVEGTNTYRADGPKPYAGSVKTLADFQPNGQWALLLPYPAAGDRYGDRIVKKAKEMFGDSLEESPVIIVPPTPTEPTAPDRDPRNLVTGRVPHPPVLIRDISKPNVQSGYGYDRVQSRKGRIRGTCTHEWMGRMSIEQALAFFGPGGERYGNALVDYTNFKDGTLVRMNDPEGTRSPWASGGGVESGGLEGDGMFFYKRFGLGAINSELISTEIMKLDSENYTPDQIETQARLAAHWHDKDGQYWFEHPYTSKYGGVMSFLHFEFGTTSCGLGELDDITKVQTRTREIMREWQYSDAKPTDPPIDPPDVPPLPTSDLPAGIPLAKAEERFNKIRKINAKTGAVVSTGSFDPEGIISLGWAHKMAELFGQNYDQWKSGGDWIFFEEPVDKTTFDVISFDGWDGLMIRKNEKQGFIWA
jgi:hypothetical protein